MGGSASCCSVASVRRPNITTEGRPIANSNTTATSNLTNTTNNANNVYQRSDPISLWKKENEHRWEGKTCVARTVMSIDGTPAGKEKEVYKYFCPICFLYLKEINKTKCCNNYVCYDCCLQHIKSKMDMCFLLPELPNEKLPISCPHCNINGVHFCPVSSTEEMRCYEESPNTKNLLDRASNDGFLNNQGLDSRTLSTLRQPNIHDRLRAKQAADEIANNHSSNAPQEVSSRGGPAYESSMRPPLPPAHPVTKAKTKPLGMPKASSSSSSSSNGGVGGGGGVEEDLASQMHSLAGGVGAGGSSPYVTPPPRAPRPKRMVLGQENNKENDPPPSSSDSSSSSMNNNQLQNQTGLYSLQQQQQGTKQPVLSNNNNHNNNTSSSSNQQPVLKKGARRGSGSNASASSSSSSSSTITTTTSANPSISTTTTNNNPSSSLYAYAYKGKAAPSSSSSSLPASNSNPVFFTSQPLQRSPPTRQDEDDGVDVVELAAASSSSSSSMDHATHVPGHIRLSPPSHNIRGGQTLVAV